MGVYESYTWIFVMAIIFAFLAAFGIGANDVANAFSTSVGSGSISLKQAIMIACIFEFSGAFFMGKHVTTTIRKGIADIELFEDEPDVFMFGMMCVCVANAGWLLFATYLKLPVSTTHTCVGGIMGFTIAYKGADGVEWSVVGKIIVSWFLSPILAGCVAVTLQSLLIKLVMESNHPSNRALICYPLLVGFTCFVVMFYTIYKGTPQLGLSDTPIGIAIGVSLAVSIFFAILSKIFAVPRLRNEIDTNSRLNKNHTDDKNKNNNNKDDIEMKNKKKQDNKDEQEEDLNTDDVIFEKSASPKEDPEKRSSFLDKIIPDINSKHKNEASVELIEMLEDTVQHDIKAEYVFTHLQVITACFNAFAHGANDVANSIGPLAAVVAVYETSEVDKKSDVPLWILGMGGVGIVAGLVMYGYKIIQVIGFEFTKLSPSRGFSIELGASLVVITGSRLELPLSTTHCVVGATIGVGLMQGCSNVNWSLIPKVIAGWVMTLIVAAVGTGLIFSFGVYSPKA